MPLRVAQDTFAQNEAMYRNSSDSYSAIKEAIMLNPLATPVRASVLHLGAAQDHQFARDGEVNGAFTAALLRVWNQGAFRGGYAAFRDQIEAQIANPAQVPHLYDKLHGPPAFIDDVPFTLGPKLSPWPDATATGGVMV